MVVLADDVRVCLGLSAVLACILSMLAGEDAVLAQPRQVLSHCYKRIVQVSRCAGVDNWVVFVVRAAVKRQLNERRA